jgi:predicted 3-demethylubiquinone-9 3-methyltransferase (glyoxalase superfamily)
MTDITPCLWYDGAAEEAASFYTTLFPDSRIDRVTCYGEGMPFPAGTAMLVEFTVAGRSYQGLNGGPQFPFTEAVSLSVTATDQAEIDRLWSALIRDGGAESMCGWCKDRWGLSWQIVPQAMIDMQRSGTPEQIGRMFAVMMSMRKLDIATLESAFRGEDA